MNCQNCGKELVHGANFCHHCGAHQNQNGKYKEKENNSSSFPIKKIDSEEKKQNENHVEYNQSSKTDKEQIDGFTSNSQNNENKQNHTPSFKRIWKNFINEDENTYSVFGEIKKQSKHIVPKKNENKSETEKSQTNSSEIKKIKTHEDFEKSSIPNSEVSYVDENLKNDSDIGRESKSIEEDSIYYSPLNEEKTNIENEKTSLFSIFKANSRKTENKSLEKESFSQGKKKVEDSTVESKNTMSAIENVSDYKRRKTTSINTILAESRNSSISIRLQSIYNQTRGKALKESPITILIFMIGFIVSSIPIFFITRQLNVNSIVLSILKVLTTFITFFIPISIASSKIKAKRTGNDSLFDTLFFWTLFHIFLTILFFCFPRDWSMGKNLLGALTPHLITAILQYILLIFVINAIYLQKENEQKNIDFLGWFLIIFITIDLMFKLFWIILNFLTGSIL